MRSRAVLIENTMASEAEVRRILEVLNWTKRGMSRWRVWLGVWTGHEMNLEELRSRFVIMIEEGWSLAIQMFAVAKRRSNEEQGDLMNGVRAPSALRWMYIVLSENKGNKSCASNRDWRSWSREPEQKRLQGRCAAHGDVCFGPGDPCMYNAATVTVDSFYPRV